MMDGFLPHPMLELMLAEEARERVTGTPSSLHGLKPGQKCGGAAPCWPELLSTGVLR